MRQVTAVVAMLAVPLCCQAHGAEAPDASPAPWVVPWLVVATVYGLGWHRLNREGRRTHRLAHAQLASFAAGMITLAATLAPALDALADRAFSAHMVQHMLLMLVAPPLLVRGRPVMVGLWAFPLARRRQIGRAWTKSRWKALHAFLMRPLMAWLAASLALWAWHIPAAYDTALASEGVHALEHLCFFVTSLMFWTRVHTFRPGTGNRAVAPVMVATFALHSGLLGALLTFAQSPLYRADVHPFPGLTRLADQQLAGLIMWVPASGVYLIALGLLLVGWLRPERRLSRPPARCMGPG